MRNKFHFFGHVVLALAAIAGFSAVVMLLWNWLMPAVFGFTAISFWKAFGLLVLARILFGGMGSGRFWGMGMMRHHHHNPIRKKWMQMTPDERKEFVKNHHWGRRGFEHHPGYDFFNEGKPEKQD